ncbi:MAG: hypothetical protein FWJ70_16300, partial [Micromonosporaceae bacterium]
IRDAELAVASGADPDRASPAVPGPLCGWCDYRRTCPAGRDRPGHEPWDAVEGLLADHPSA